MIIEEEDKKEIMKDVAESDLLVGIGIEKEHEPTIAKIKGYIDKNGGMPDSKSIYEWISLDHLREYKQYYNDQIGLPNMERELKATEPDVQEEEEEISQMLDEGKTEDEIVSKIINRRK